MKPRFYLIILFTVFYSLSAAQSTLDKKLLSTARSGSLQEIKDLVEQGANVNARGEEKITPLHIAAKYQSSDVIQYLIDEGAKVNSKMNDFCRYQPIHYAAATNSHPEVIRLLVREGADIHASLRRLKYTPLIEAARSNRYPEVLKTIIELGADVNYDKAFKHETPLYSAVTANIPYEENIRVLLESGADVNEHFFNQHNMLSKAITNKYNKELTGLILNKILDHERSDYMIRKGLKKAGLEGVDLFSFATAYTNLESMKALVKQGVDTEQRSVVKFICNNDTINAGSPLCIAIALNEEDKVEYLLRDMKMDVNEREVTTEYGVFGATPLIYTIIAENNLKMAEYLLDFGADPAITDGLDESLPLHWAAYKNNIELVEIFIREGNDINAKNKDGITPLLYSAMHDNMDIFELFLEKGADIKSVNNNEQNALHIASASNQLEKVKTLVEMGLDINTPDAFGQTPLIFSSRYNYIDMFRYLLDRGASLETIDHLGRTPLHFAASEGYQELVMLLADAGADINATDNRNRTPLFLAVANGHVDVAKSLCSAGADPDILNNLGYSAIFFAVVNQDRTLTEILCANHADLNTKGGDGNLPIHYAINNRNLELTRILVENGSDLNVEGKAGLIPLDLALKNQYNEIANYLFKVKGPEDSHTSVFDKFIDMRDQNVYRTVRIGKDVWFAEDLRYTNVGGMNYTVPKARTPGLLYNDHVNDDACPEGWHISTMDEWKSLLNYVTVQKGLYDQNSGENANQTSWQGVGKYLKSQTDWKSRSGNTDDYGFNALPLGKAVLVNGGFEKADYGTHVTYWSGDMDHIWVIEGQSDNVIIGENASGYQFWVYHAIRCVKD